MRWCGKGKALMGSSQSEELRPHGHMLNAVME